MEGSLLRVNKSIKSNRGVAMVEFAIVLPILLLLFGGIIDFGYMMHQYLVVDELARSAARYSSVNQSNDDAKLHALNGRTDVSNWDMNFDFVKKVVVNEDKTLPERSQVTVTVSCKRIELNGLLLGGLGNVVLPKTITRNVVAMTE